MVGELIRAKWEVSLIRSLQVAIKSLRNTSMILSIVLILNSVVRLFIDELYFKEVKVHLSSQWESKFLMEVLVQSSNLNELFHIQKFSQSFSYSCIAQQES